MQLAIRKTKMHDFKHRVTSETATVLGLSHSRVHERKTSSPAAALLAKTPCYNESGQRKMGRLVKANRNDKSVKKEPTGVVCGSVGLGNVLIIRRLSVRQSNFTIGPLTSNCLNGSSDLAFIKHVHWFGKEASAE